MPRTVIIVENDAVPQDRRVWQEAVSLERAGYEVAVVAPVIRGTQSKREILDGIDVRRFRLRPARNGALGYLVEYAGAVRALSRELRRMERDGPPDVVHASNPPDFLLLCALRARRRGAALIFDQHDLFPEMVDERFPPWAARIVRPFALACERLAHALADVSIVTNDSFRELALRRGRVDPADVFVVRNGPSLDRFVPVAPDPALARGRAHLLVYVGLMAPQDGVDRALEALAVLHDRRSDWHALFLGDGPMLEELRQLTHRLGLDEHVEFGGFVDDATLRRAISSADVCLAPDPVTPLTDVSTLVKIAEYLAIGGAIVSYNLKETRRTAGDAAVYATDDSPQAFAAAIENLLDDPARRRELGRRGRERVASELAWEHAETRLLEAYERARLLAARRRPPAQ